MCLASKNDVYDVSSIVRFKTLSYKTNHLLCYSTNDFACKDKKHQPRNRGWRLIYFSLVTKHEHECFISVNDIMMNH